MTDRFCHDDSQVEPLLEQIKEPIDQFTGDGAYDDTFFIIKVTPKRGRKITFNTQAVNQYIKRYAGFQALLSNSIKDPLKALQVYRDKDVVEKCFDDLKNQLDMKRLRMHSSATTDGRLFVQFIALIYVSARLCFLTP